MGVGLAAVTPRLSRVSSERQGDKAGVRASPEVPVPGSAAMARSAVLLGPEDEIRAMLEQVRAAGMAQREERSALLDALLSMAECGPDICESFFTAPHRDQATPCPASAPAGAVAERPVQALPGAGAGSLFDLCLDMLCEASEPIAAQLSQVLIAVACQVGLGTRALRRMMQLLFTDSGEWSANARQMVGCITRMGQLEGADERMTNPVHFFVMDGVSSGLYLGGDSDWVWAEGFTFAAWVWKDGNEPVHESSKI